MLGLIIFGIIFFIVEGIGIIIIFKTYESSNK